VRIYYTVRSDVICETGFDNTFYYFGNERQMRDWPIAGEFFFIQCWFFSSGEMMDSFRVITKRVQVPHE